MTSLTAYKDPTLVVVTPAADQSRAASRGEPAGTRDPSRAASMEPLLELPSDGSGLSKEGSASGVAATPRGDALDGDALHHDVTNLESIADVGDDVEAHAQDPSRVSSSLRQPQSRVESTTLLRSGAVTADDVVRSKAGDGLVDPAASPGTPIQRTAQPSRQTTAGEELDKPGASQGDVTAGSPHAAPSPAAEQDTQIESRGLTGVQSEQPTIDATSRDPTMFAAQTPSMVSHDLTALSAVHKEPTDATAAAEASNEATLVASRVVSRRQSLTVPEVTLEGEPQVARKLSMGSEAASQILDAVDQSEQSPEKTGDTLDNTDDVSQKPQTPALEITPGDWSDDCGDVPDVS